MSIKGIIFDLDGTLIDSMKVWENVDREFLKENGAIYTPDVSEAVKKMAIGQSAEYFKSRFNLSHSTEYIINRIEEMVSEKYHNEIPLKEGVYQALHELSEKNIKMCVATATYNSLVNAALKRLNIYDIFEFVLTCSDVGSGKDSPEIFEQSLSRLGLDKKEVIVVEDSLHCIETAKKAGFTVVAMYDFLAEADKEKIHELSDYEINDMRDLCSVVF